MPTEGATEFNRLLVDTAIIIVAGLLFALVARRLRFSPLLGYLIAGLVIGPYGLGLVRNLGNVSLLAQVGVVLLMFALGIQLSLRQLWEIRDMVLIAGLGHSLLAIIVGLIAGILLGLSHSASLVLGYAVALCSSVVLVRLLSDEDATHTAYGRVALGISVTQDLFAVVLISTLPLLSRGPGVSILEVSLALLRAITFIVIIIIAARWLMPWLLQRISATGSREIFLFTVLAISLTGALLSAWAGLSLALGAFLAGLVISESIYSLAVLSEIIPLRDVFGLLFFISLGMLVNPAWVIAEWPVGLVLLLIAVVGKTGLVYILLRLLRQHPYLALITGVLIAQIGEFSFIIARAAQQAGIISAPLYTVVLAVSIVSIALNPVLLPAAHAVYRRLSQAGIIGYPDMVEPSRTEDGNSVLICGYGRVGHTIGQALDTFRVPFMVIDIDRHKVEALRRRGIRALYGDATNVRFLERSGATRFALGVIAVDKSEDVHLIALQLRRLCPSMRLLLRSHSERQTERYLALGVADVVHVEMEASLVFVCHVLTRADVDAEIVDAYLDDIRTDYYEALLPPEQRGG